MRPRLEWRRWRSRIVLGIMALTLLILAGVSLYTYRAFQGAAADLAIENDRQITYVGAARLRDELTRFSDQLGDLARSHELYGGQTQEQQAALRAARHRLTIFDGGVVLLDNFGQVRASEPARPEIQGADWSNRPFFRELLGTTREYFSDVIPEGPDGAPVAVVSVPIVGERGEFSGVLAGMFRLGESRISSLYASIIRLRMEQSDNTYVVDRAGRILYDSSFSNIGGVVQLPTQSETDIQGVALQTTNAEGNDIIAAYAPIVGTGWTLVTENGWAAATSDTQRYANSLVVLLALGTILPALGVVLLIRTKNAEMIEQERGIHEQRLAWMIQERLLPRAAPMLPGWSLDVFFKPHPSSGGDFYDFFLLPDGMLALTLGHANADGLDAVHIIDTVRAALRGATQLQLSPDKALVYGNKLVCPELQGEACVSALYAMLDPATGKLDYATAGAIPPWVVVTPEADQVPTEGVSLGKGVDNEFQHSLLTIQPGETVLLISAGLFRSHRPNGDPFDLHALHAISATPGYDAEQIVEALAAQLKSYTGTKGLPPEDVTVVVVQRHGESPAPAAASQPALPVKRVLAVVEPEQGQPQ